MDLDPALLSTSEPVCELGLCAVRLQADSRFPWLVLVPMRPNAKELEDLADADRALLVEEAMAAGKAVRAMGEALGRPVGKLNIAALGNVTPQLHVHVVGRRDDDAAWPGPVWGVSGAAPYSAGDLEVARNAARTALGVD